MGANRPRSLCGILLVSYVETAHSDHKTNGAVEKYHVAKSQLAVSARLPSVQDHVGYTEVSVWNQ